MSLAIGQSQIRRRFALGARDALVLEHPYPAVAERINEAVDPLLGLSEAEWPNGVHHHADVFSGD